MLQFKEHKFSLTPFLFRFAIFSVGVQCSSIRYGHVYRIVNMRSVRHCAANITGINIGRRSTTYFWEMITHKHIVSFRPISAHFDIIFVI